MDLMDQRSVPGTPVVIWPETHPTAATQKWYFSCGKIFNNSVNSVDAEKNLVLDVEGRP